MLHKPIFNIDFLIHVARDDFQRSFVEATVGNGVLREMIFNDKYDWLTVGHSGMMLR